MGRLKSILGVLGAALFALGLVLVGYWAAFAIYPLPGPDFDYTKVGVPKDWPHLMTGFAAHWNKNSNLGNAFDQWFLNLFPRTKPFWGNSGGYLTLSFIASSFRIHLGSGVFQSFGAGLEPLLRGGAVLLVYWLILLWMYRRRIFLKI